MYACYIDESGHCGEKYDPNQPVEIICGVLTDMTKLFKTQRELNRILSNLRSLGIGTNELKAGEIYRGRKGWSKISHHDRRKIIEDLLQWSHDRSCKYLIAPIDAKKFFDRKVQGCSISHFLQYPYEAGCINILLGLQRLQKSKRKNKGKTWVILDEQSSHDKRISRLLDEDLSMTDAFTGFNTKGKNSRLGEIIDIPLFSKSHKSIVIQVADLVAFIVNRYLRIKVYKCEQSYSGELQVIEGWYSKIKNDIVLHSLISPAGNDPLVKFYRDVRPDGWNHKNWFV